MAAPASARPTRTQQERREATRSRLLDGAARTLVDHGLSGFTTANVAAAAGLSNGALFRHFPTRAELLAATAEHVLARLRRTYEARFDALDPTARTPRPLLEVLWEIMADPELAAVYELFTQARTDEQLLAALQPIVAEHGDHVRHLAAAVNDRGTHVEPAVAGPLTSLAVLAMQGLVLNNLAGTWHGTERDLIDVVAAIFESAPTVEPVTTGALP